MVANAGVDGGLFQSCFQRAAPEQRERCLDRVDAAAAAEHVAWFARHFDENHITPTWAVRMLCANGSGMIAASAL